MLVSDTNSDWKSLYNEAVCETDRSRIAERVAAARRAILDRVAESIQNRILGEQSVMDAALRNLRRLADSQDPR